MLKLLVLKADAKIGMYPHILGSDFMNFIGLRAITNFSSN